MTQELQDHQPARLAMRPFYSSDTLGALGVALAKAQGKIEGAKKDSANPFFHSKYADLASVWDACRGPLSDNGLAVIQLPGHNDAGMFVDTILTHASGEWISGRLFMTPVKDDPQGIGSAITYARRYGLQAIVGIAPEDDDGNAASGKDGAQTHQDARGTAGRTDDRAEQPPIETEPFEGDWQDVEIGFGKDKGKTLGSLQKKKLDWYKTTWQPKPWNGKISPADLKLRSALDSIGKAPVAGNEPLPEDDQLPMFNGKSHEELSEFLIWEKITEEEFMDAARKAKLIPESAKSFRLMSDDTAAEFLKDTDVVKNAVKAFREAA